MRIYECEIKYEITGCFGDENKKSIWVKAKNIKEAIEKASHYRETGEVKKVIEVIDAKLQGTIDKE